MVRRPNPRDPRRLPAATPPRGAGAGVVRLRVKRKIPHIRREVIKRARVRFLDTCQNIIRPDRPPPLFPVVRRIIERGNSHRPRRAGDPDPIFTMIRTKRAAVLPSRPRRVIDQTRNQPRPRRRQECPRPPLILRETEPGRARPVLHRPRDAPRRPSRLLFFHRHFLALHYRGTRRAGRRRERPALANPSPLDVWYYSIYPL